MKIRERVTIIPWIYPKTLVRNPSTVSNSRGLEKQTEPEAQLPDDEDPPLELEPPDEELPPELLDDDERA